MKSKIIVAALLTLASSAVMAAGENNVGSCGWGSKVFDGQSGVFPQVLAATTNGSTGNQTFGITFGTSGCTQDGMIKSNYKTAMFIDGNKDKLAQDMSKGNGETLVSLAKLIGVSDSDKAAFFRATKENFAQIYATETASADQVAANLKQVLAANSSLAQYAAAI
ncbi:MAG: hypothetical protein RL020_1983 [Pseudomonadota bacterium]|jgi:Protein of unknown function (DUF3015)